MLRLNDRWVPLSATARAVASTIQPVHELAIVIPNAEYEDHAATQSLAHCIETAKLSTRSAAGCGDTITTRLSASNLDTVLDIGSYDLDETPGCCSIVRDKLRRNGERFGGINDEARSVVAVISSRVRVEATATPVTIVRIARMRSKGVGISIGLQYIHFVTAIALTTGIHSTIPPCLNWTLCVTIPRSVVCASRVVLTTTSGRCHLGEV